MNLESDQQEFEQLEFNYNPPETSGALIVALDNDVTTEHAIELRDRLQELLPEGCRAIVLSGVRHLTYVPGRL